MIPYLKSQGIHSIDYMIMTHADKDHISGQLELIEMIYQDRIQKYWVRAVEGENPQSSNCSEETARSYIAQYHPIELNMKPFSEYPFS